MASLLTEALPIPFRKWALCIVAEFVCALLYPIIIQTSSTFSNRRTHGYAKTHSLVQTLANYQNAPNADMSQPIKIIMTHYNWANETDV